MRKYLVFLTVLTALLFTACQKQPQKVNLAKLNYGLSEDQWFEKIIKNIKIGGEESLELAEKNVWAMMSEHKSSELAKKAALIVANSHIKHGEYDKAILLYDELGKKFSDTQDFFEYSMYMGLRARYLSLDLPNREQALMDDLLAQSEDFIAAFPRSKYLILVQNINMRIKLSLFYLDIQNEKLYARANNKISQEFYKKRINANPLKSFDIVGPALPSHSKYFEKF